MEAKVVWDSDMMFVGHQNGHEIILDTDEKFGGHDRGSQPKHLVLTALAGCTAMDVISILKKMRLDVDVFEVKTSAELTPEHPKVFTSIHIQYIFKGKNLVMEKLEKAVSLSRERYCGVSIMLAKICEITYEIITENDA